MRIKEFIRHVTVYNHAKEEEETLDIQNVTVVYAETPSDCLVLLKISEIIYGKNNTVSKKLPNSTIPTMALVWEETIK